MSGIGCRALAFFDDEAVERTKSRYSCGCVRIRGDDLVVLDVTASEQLADQYLDTSPATVFMRLAPINWRAQSASDKYARRRRRKPALLLHNATVGAGLPINHTVRDLIDSGDKDLRPRIFRTLSRLFLQFDGTVPFTDLVDSQGLAAGLTGTRSARRSFRKDVMRKLVILARGGYDIEPIRCV